MDDKEKQFVNDLLDASLRNYTAGEPRAGLEGRILAGARARQQETRRRTAWAWAAAISGVSAMIMLVVFHRSYQPAHQPAALEPAIAKYPARLAAPTVAIITPPVKLPVPHQVSRHAGVRAVNWRPQQFPTPRPLSEQERLLLAYAQAVESSKAAVSSPAKEDSEQAMEIPPLKIVALDIVPLSSEESNDNR